MKPKCGANLNQGDSEQKTERKGMESGKEKIQEIQAPKIQMAWKEKSQLIRILLIAWVRLSLSVDIHRYWIDANECIMLFVHSKPEWSL